MQIQPIPTKIKKKGRLLDLDISFGGVPTKDIVVYTRQLSTMIDAGLPLVRSLDVLAEQQKNKTFQNSINQVKESVESGTSFADALAVNTQRFFPTYM